MKTLFSCFQTILNDKKIAEKKNNFPQKNYFSFNTKPEKLQQKLKNKIIFFPPFNYLYNFIFWNIYINRVQNTIPIRLSIPQPRAHNWKSLPFRPTFLKNLFNTNSNMFIVSNEFHSMYYYIVASILCSNTIATLQSIFYLLFQSDAKK